MTCSLLTPWLSNSWNGFQCGDYFRVSVLPTVKTRSETLRVKVRSISHVSTFSRLHPCGVFRRNLPLCTVLQSDTSVPPWAVLPSDSRGTLTWKKTPITQRCPSSPRASLTILFQLDRIRFSFPVFFLCETKTYFNFGGYKWRWKRKVLWFFFGFGIYRLFYVDETGYTS